MAGGHPRLGELETRIEELEEKKPKLELELAERKDVQRGLSSLGWDVGPIDGLFGIRTREALGAWQSERGLCCVARNFVRGFVGLFLIGRVLISHIAPPSSESGASADRAPAFTGTATTATITVLVVTVRSPARRSSWNGRAGGWWRVIQNVTSSSNRSSGA